MSNLAPKWFKPFTITALIWNILGLIAWVLELTITPEVIATLPQAQQEIYAASPSWLWMATGLAVISGTIGTVGLLMKRAWSLVLLLSSVVALVIQDVVIVFVVDPVAPVGTAVFVLQFIVLVVGLALMFVSRKMIREGWANAH